MPTYSKYRVIDQENGAYLTPEIPNIIDVLPLSGVATTSGSNEITVASTTGLFPGMSLHVPGVPMGAFIHAVKSSTVIVAFAPVYDPTTATFTVTAANAQATATATGLTGIARGYNAHGVPMPDMDGATYRNDFGHTGAGWSATGEYTSSGPTTNKAEKAVAGQPGVIVVPSSLSVAQLGAGTVAQTGITLGTASVTPKVADSVNGTPPRPLGRWTSWALLITDQGAVTAIRKTPTAQIVRTGSSTATS